MAASALARIPSAIETTQKQLSQPQHQQQQQKEQAESNASKKSNRKLMDV